MEVHMVHKKLLTVALVGCATLAATLAVRHATAQPATEVPAGAQPAMQLPPGWTQADMQTCMAAITPGKMHEHLAKGVGTWKGNNTMWMYPGADPVKTQCTSVVTSMMDGRFIKIEMAGEMPGMGPFNGFGINGYDNAAGKFVSMWIDNCTTSILNGAGELSPDGKTTTWVYTYTCPLTKKPTKMRQIETMTGPNTMTLEAHATDPKSGKEYKMISIEFTKQ
jgi:uncharacterized protein YfaP (DUF2135 family)